MNSREESVAQLQASLRELSGHVPFQKFMEAVKDLREIAINDACLFERAANPNTTYGAIGRIQAYQELIDLVVQAQIQPPSDEPPVG